MQVPGLRHLFDVARMARQFSVPGAPGPASGARDAEPPTVEMPPVDAPWPEPPRGGIPLEAAWRQLADDARAQVFAPRNERPGFSPGGVFSPGEIERMQAEAAAHPLADSPPARPAYSTHISAYDAQFDPASETEVRARQEAERLALSPAALHSRSCDPYLSWECLIGFRPSKPAKWPPRNHIDELVRTKDQGDLSYFAAQLRALNLCPVDVAHARHILQSQLGKDEL